VQRIVKEMREAGPQEQIKATEIKTLDEMSREERFAYIKVRIESTPRFRMTFEGFQQRDKDVFLDEYLKIIRSTDTITEAEEQALFAAILEFVLSLQALRRKEMEEHLYEESMQGNIDEASPRYRTYVNDKYQKEYDQHMKLYQKGMEQLKMARRDRLKDVRTERRTLVDLAEELSTKTAQADAAKEIEELSRKRDEELKVMLENGYIHGKFDE
jgi:hypothetical protein